MSRVVRARMLKWSAPRTGRKWRLGLVEARAIAVLEELKPGMTFTDSTPFDAEAVKANWTKEKDVANRSPSLTTLLQVADPTSYQLQPLSYFSATVTK